MKRKSNRTWTPEQRQAAADRMRENQKIRWDKRRKDAAEVALMTPPEVQAELNDRRNAEVDAINMAVSPSIVNREVSPEVQAVLASMTPERKAKLAAIQARTMAMGAGRADGAATLEAIQRHQAEKAGLPPTPQKAYDEMEGHFPSKAEIIHAIELPPVVIPLPAVHMKHPFRFTSGSNGLMISELSDCICGQPRLKWHPICLKVPVRG